MQTYLRSRRRPTLLSGRFNAGRVLLINTHPALATSVQYMDDRLYLGSVVNATARYGPPLCFRYHMCFIIGFAIQTEYIVSRAW